MWAPGDYGNMLEVEPTPLGDGEGVCLRKRITVTVVSSLGEIRKMESGLKDS